eukprot:GDKI01030242.1.p1 GENE.GDKI01030242.1~~GDKI01030242.1.p1  ORF type:complete len:159 (-),score=30.55 GDKI01030242.1:64-540(-)
MLCAVCVCAYVWAYGRSTYKKESGGEGRDRNSIWLPVCVGYVCVVSHLLCDICTHQQFMCEEAVEHKRHIYMYPFFQGVSFHLDCLFGLSYSVRLFLELCVYLPFMWAVVLYRWWIYNQNPFKILTHFFFNTCVCRENLPLVCVTGALCALTLYSDLK